MRDAPGGASHSLVLAFLRFFLGLAKAGDALALFPLAALFEQFETLKALEHITLAAQRRRRPQTPMLSHILISLPLSGPNGPFRPRGWVFTMPCASVPTAFLFFFF